MNRPCHLHDRIDQTLLQATFAGLAFSLLLPFAQVNTQAFGWLPLWLVGLPLSAWLGRRWRPDLHGRQQRRRKGPWPVSVSRALLTPVGFRRVSPLS